MAEKLQVPSVVLDAATLVQKHIKEPIAILKIAAEQINATIEDTGVVQDNKPVFKVTIENQITDLAYGKQNEWLIKNIVQKLKMIFFQLFTINQRLKFLKC